MNERLATLKVEQHPDKTFVGRVERGFDFLGYRFQSAGLTGVAQQTVERFVERTTRLYEQGADAIRIGEYGRRWLRWVGAGIADSGDLLIRNVVSASAEHGLSVGLRRCLFRLDPSIRTE